MSQRVAETAEIGFGGGGVRRIALAVDVLIGQVVEFVGATLVLALGFLRSGATWHTRIVVAATGLGIACWLITESHTLWPAFGSTALLLPPADAVGGLFWLFVLTVFDDRRPTPLLWAPALLLGATCSTIVMSGPIADWIWAARNVMSGLLAVHAAVISSAAAARRAALGGWCFSPDLTDSDRSARS